MKTSKQLSATLLACLLVATGAMAFTADPPPADAPAAKSPAAKETEEFQPPPGFARKTRGKLVLYCKRDNALGTRIRTESCYNESQMREYMLALKQQQQDVDRIRNNCGNICVCGSPEACNPNIVK